MSRIAIYWVDAFADEVGHGNPAAVCTLPEWLPDEVLQGVADENGLSETAYLVPDRDPMPLRWFTPTEEVGLCGHATLAAGFVVLDMLAPDRQEVRFSTRRGDLLVSRTRGGQLTVDLPVIGMASVDDPPASLVEGLGVEPVEVWVTEEDPNYVAILDSEAAVAAVRPDLSRLKELHPRGVAVSARGDETDFVSRYFAPGYGIPEDPVTGSTHCALGPYWSHRLDRAELDAVQLSARGGRIGVGCEDNRVRLTGSVACYLTGAICCLPSGRRRA